MDQKDWITKANKMLKEYPDMSKDEVIKTLKDQGFARPTGIEGRDSRSFKKKTRSSSGIAGRKAQEKVSTETSAKNTKLQRQLIAEDLGIAEYSGLEKPFFEHTYSQDISGLLEEGAPGDYVERLPTQDSAFKTEAERISRQNYKNRFAIVTTPEGFRAVPREYFSELPDPSTLPGIDLDPNVSIKEQFNKYTSSFNFNKGGARLKPAQAVRAARGVSPLWASLPLGVTALGMSGQSALANPSAETFEDVGWDAANLVADAASLIPVPMVVAGAEGAQKLLGIAHQARIGQRELAKQEGLSEPLEKFVEDPLNEFEYFGKQALNFFGSAVRMASPLGL